MWLEKTTLSTLTRRKKLLLNKENETMKTKKKERKSPGKRKRKASKRLKTKMRIRRARKMKISCHTAEDMEMSTAVRMMTTAMKEGQTIRLMKNHLK